jgi:hypothetical protein
MPVNSRRRQHLRKQRLQKNRSIKAKTKAKPIPAKPIIIARNPLDIYTLGSEISRHQAQDNCVITTYNELNDPSLIITKYVYKSTPTTLKSLAEDYNKLYTRLHSIQGIYKNICFNDNYEPAGFVIQPKPQSAGSLCSYSEIKYTQGKQIGKNDQGGQDADALYLEKSDDSLLIQRLTGEGNTNPGEAFRAIYSEIKLTKKAYQEKVSPQVVYATIVSDSSLMPVGYIVMERIIGKYLSEAEVRTNAAEIHKLIDILYDNGITHNDLHNRNIMKGYTESTLHAKEPRIYIIDYGSALIGKPPIEQKKREYRIAITFEGGNTHKSYKTFISV